MASDDLVIQRPRVLQRLLDRLGVRAQRVPVSVVPEAIFTVPLAIPQSGAPEFMGGTAEQGGAGQVSGVFVVNPSGSNILVEVTQIILSVVTNQVVSVRVTDPRR